jgi:hypothetical protein
MPGIPVALPAAEVAFIAVALPAEVAFIAVALPAEVAFIAVAFVPVMFCCAMAVSLLITDNNPDMNAAATNIPAMGIAAIALAVLLLLLLLSGPLCRVIDVDEGI